jgi:hypothetical protein
MPIQRIDDALELVFSRGFYRAVPLGVSYQFATASTLSGP